jgi:RNA polymerase sigma factor (sigma-70 family)
MSGMGCDMAAGHANEVIDQLRRIVLSGEEHSTDGQLLERFVRRRDGSALETLVRRHSALVWGVCRRVLRDYHDAEDAFQATFLVLVRKAASIRSRELLANWLYGVAHQTAIKARQTAARRRARERQVMNMPEPEAVQHEHELGFDWQPLFDRELSLLPEKYRAVIVLSDLEGKNRKQTARQLGLPEGTVGSRLARARALLAARLARHGVAVSGGTLAAVLCQTTAACAPASVLSSTIKAASLVAAGETAAAGLISANVAALTQGVLKAMLLVKLKAATLALSLTGLVLLGGVFACGLAAVAPEQAVWGTAPAKKDAAGARPVDADRPDNGPEANGAAGIPLNATVQAKKKRVRVGEEFEVRLRVVNASRSPQSFQVMSCSWDDHWQSSNDRVSWAGWDCRKNIPVTVNLDPGQAYEKDLSMFIVPGKLQREFAFQMGFTPLKSKQTYWSNVVILQLESGNPAGPAPGEKGREPGEKEIRDLVRGLSQADVKWSGQWIGFVAHLQSDRARKLGAIGAPAIPALIEALSDKDRFASAHAILTMIAFGGVPELIPCNNGIFIDIPADGPIRIDAKQRFELKRRWEKWHQTSPRPKRLPF